jgi:hypothetical protein
MDDTVVKLCSNTSTKTLLQEAVRVKHFIEVNEDSFYVRDQKTQNVIFRGIKIRRDIWGVTFSKDLIC